LVIDYRGWEVGRNGKWLKTGMRDLMGDRNILEPDYDDIWIPCPSVLCVTRKHHYKYRFCSTSLCTWASEVGLAMAQSSQWLCREARVKYSVRGRLAGSRRAWADSRSTPFQKGKTMSLSYVWWNSQWPGSPVSGPFSMHVPLRQRNNMAVYNGSHLTSASHVPGTPLSFLYVWIHLIIMVTSLSSYDWEVSIQVRVLVACR
jgi:hypothetical protein